MLGLYMEAVRRAGIAHSVVVTLDEATTKYVQQHGGAIKAHEHKLVAKGGTGNHATSGLKFRLLIPWLKAGCHVLLSDVDVVWLQNPFTLPSLYRDADVEGMTDGWHVPAV